MKILIVEDNQDSAESLQDILEMEGHTVHLTETGEAALEKDFPDQAELSLVNLKIPAMGGRAMIERVFEMDSGARVIVLTGNSIKEEIEEVAKMPILKVIRKPYDPGKLLNEIDKIRSDNAT